jgi:hypothetical protein
MFHLPTRTPTATEPLVESGHIPVIILKKRREDPLLAVAIAGKQRPEWSFG